MMQQGKKLSLWLIEVVRQIDDEALADFLLKPLRIVIKIACAPIFFFRNLGRLCIFRFFQPRVSILKIEHRNGEKK